MKIVHILEHYPGSETSQAVFLDFDLLPENVQKEVLRVDSIGGADEVDVYTNGYQSLYVKHPSEINPKTIPTIDVDEFLSVEFFDKD